MRRFISILILVTILVLVSIPVLDFVVNGVNEENKMNEDFNIPVAYYCEYYYFKEKQVVGMHNDDKLYMQNMVYLRIPIYNQAIQQQVQKIYAAHQEYLQSEYIFEDEQAVIEKYRELMRADGKTEWWTISNEIIEAYQNV